MAPSGKFALGLCDRCSLRYPLGELKWEIVNGERSGQRVCGDCFDIDHPQYQLSKIKFGDEFSVPDPRPQTAGDLDPTLAYNWADMFGNVSIPSGLHVTGGGEVGSVTVVIS